MTNQIDVYSAGDGFRWRYIHEANGNTMADSGQGYTDIRDATHALDVIFGELPQVRLPGGELHPLVSTEAAAVQAALVVLTLVTGEPWDTAKLIAQAGDLRSIATRGLRAKGVTKSDAEALVEQRWETYVAPIEPTPAEPSIDMQPPPDPGTFAERFRAYQERKNENTSPTVT